MTDTTAIDAKPLYLALDVIDELEAELAALRAKVGG